MMLRTCTVQTNLDFLDEADMVEKFRVSLALQPVATALFANSPFREGAPTGLLSTRSHVWTDTDPDRCGILPFVFEPVSVSSGTSTTSSMCPCTSSTATASTTMSPAPRSATSWRAGCRVRGTAPAHGRLGRPHDHQLPRGQAEEIPGDARGRQRSAPHHLRPVRLLGRPAVRRCSQSAAWELVRDWTAEEHETLRRDVPRLGLATPFRDGTLQDIARATVSLAHDGLRRRARLDAAGNDETGYLEPLRQVAQSGTTLAETLLEAYRSRWNGSMDPVWEEMRY